VKGKVLHVCILDDDKTLAKLLQHVLTEYLTEKEIAFSVDTYYSGNSLSDALERTEKQYHIYFLDILMQGITGIQVAKKIRIQDKNAHIIFLTSSPEFALEGYEVRAYDYLLKPLQREKLYSTLEELLEMEHIPPVKQLQITTNGSVKNVPYRDIVYIEVRRNKLLLVMNTGEELETYSTITEMVSLLKEETVFTRTHRSFLINMQYIKEITSTSIRLRPDYYIPVSRTYSAAVKQDYFDFAKAFFS